MLPVYPVKHMSWILSRKEQPKYFSSQLIDLTGLSDGHWALGSVVIEHTGPVVPIKTEIKGLDLITWRLAYHINWFRIASSFSLLLYHFEFKLQGRYNQLDRGVTTVLCACARLTPVTRPVWRNSTNERRLHLSGILCWLLAFCSHEYMLRQFQLEVTRGILEGS